jgi:DNA-binding transcriptional ArsR family regulator
MAHPLRWEILCSLGERELSVGEIVERNGTSQSNISQHLEQLRNKNIVVARKEANRIYYRIRNHQLLDLMGIMRDILCPANPLPGQSRRPVPPVRSSLACCRHPNMGLRNRVG